MFEPAAPDRLGGLTIHYINSLRSRRLDMKLRELRQVLRLWPDVVAKSLIGRLSDLPTD